MSFTMDGVGNLVVDTVETEFLVPGGPYVSASNQGRSYLVGGGSYLVEPESTAGTVALAGAVLFTMTATGDMVYHYLGRMSFTMDMVGVLGDVGLAGTATFTMTMSGSLSSGPIALAGDVTMEMTATGLLSTGAPPAIEWLSPGGSFISDEGVRSYLVPGGSYIVEGVTDDRLRGEITMSMTATGNLTAPSVTLAGTIDMTMTATGSLSGPSPVIDITVEGDTIAFTEELSHNVVQLAGSMTMTMNATGDLQIPTVPLEGAITMTMTADADLTSAAVALAGTMSFEMIGVGLLGPPEGGDEGAAMFHHLHNLGVYA